MGELKKGTHDRVSVGQEWTYQTRANETESTIVVGRIDQDEDGDIIVHVSVQGLGLRNPYHPDGRVTEVAHLPFSAEAIETSLGQSVGEASPSPDFEAGYAAWREAYVAGEAGVFTIPIREALRHVEETLSR